MRKANIVSLFVSMLIKEGYNFNNERKTVELPPICRLASFMIKQLWRNSVLKKGLG